MMAPADEMLADTAEPTVAGEYPILHGRYLVDLTAPRPGFASPLVDAYPAHRSTSAHPPLLALLCKPELPQRFATLVKLKDVGVPNMLNLHDAGIAGYSAVIGRRFTLVVDRPSGARLAAAGAEAWDALSEKEVSRFVIGPVSEALRVLHANGVVHGGVRPDNLFFSAPEPSPVLLGEGFSGPCGVLQPVSAETIARGQSLPAGRGEGLPATDWYALGATILLMLRGKDPLHGKTVAEVASAKLAEGSFKTLCTGSRLTNSMLHLLRGLLEDDPELRWGFSEVHQWLSGIALSPRSVVRAPLQPFRFGGTDHVSLRAVAHAFSQDWREAATVLRDGSVEEWLRKHTELRGHANDIHAILHPGGSKSAPGDEELVAKAILTIDPKGPIRYRDAAVMPEALGPSFAAALSSGDPKRLDSFSGLLRMGLPIESYERRHKGSRGSSQMRTLLAAQQTNVAKLQPGFGHERCLYDLNPELSCRSPLVGDHWVATLDDLLPALDEVARGQPPAGDPMDDHIAAFIGNRLNLTTGSELGGLAAPSTKPEVRRLAVLALLAMVHQRRGRPHVPDLTAWIAGRLSPVFDTIKNRERRRLMSEQVDLLANSGDLGKLMKAVADPEIRRIDEAGFEAARRRYAWIKKRIHRIQFDTDYREGLVRAMGNQIAAFVALAALLLTIFAVLFAQF